MFSIRNIVGSLSDNNTSIVPVGATETQRLFADYPDLLTIAHLQELTGLSGQTLRREVAEGRLPGVKLGRRIFIPKYRLISFVECGSNGEAL